MGEISGLGKVKMHCDKCREAFELACTDLQGTETFLEKIKTVLLAVEQWNMDLQTIEEIDKEISKLKAEGVALQGHRINTVISLLDAFMGMDYLISSTKKYNLLHQIFYSGKIYIPTEPAQQDMDYFLHVFTKLPVKDLQTIVDIHQPEYLGKIAPYIKKVIKTKLQNLLPNLSVDDGFKKELFQELGKLYPNVGKSNFRYLDNANNVDALHRDFSKLVDECTQAIHKAINEGLEKNFQKTQDVSHLFQTILIIMGHIDAKFKNHYQSFVAEHVQEVFKQIQRRKTPDTPAKPKPEILLSKTEDPDPEASGANQIPNEVTAYIDELMIMIGIRERSKKEFSKYLLRLYRNKKPIKLDVLYLAYELNAELLTQQAIDTARGLGIFFEKSSEQIPESDEEEFFVQTSTPTVNTQKSSEGAPVVCPAQISSMEECIKAFTDANYVFANTKNFIKQFESLFTNNLLKRIARNQIQKKITVLKKKNKEFLQCRTIEFTKTGHRIIIYENQNKQKVVHGIFTHDQSERELSKLK